MPAKEIKPCPFCGVIPELFPKDPATEGRAWGSVVCTNPKCRVQPGVGDNATVCDDRGTKAYQRLALKWWNRRAETT